jgi:regulatory protein
MTAEPRPHRRRFRPAGGGPSGPTPGSLADSGPEPDPESVARTIVLRRLTDAPRSRAELAADLSARDVPAAVADRVLDRFTEVGLVDDAAFADAWVRSRHATRGLSRSALRRELRGKGVDDETVAVAVEAIDADAEEAAARALVARRLRSTGGLPREARVRRLVGQLARKGYPGGLAARLVREALDAEAADTEAADTEASDIEASDAEAAHTEAADAEAAGWRPTSTLIP